MKILFNLELCCRSDLHSYPTPAFFVRIHFSLCCLECQLHWNLDIRDRVCRIGQTKNQRPLIFLSLLQKSLEIWKNESAWARYSEKLKKIGSMLFCLLKESITVGSSQAFGIFLRFLAQAFWCIAYTLFLFVALPLFNYLGFIFS